MAKPLSFIIPTYQNYNQLIQAVTSILETSYPVEIVIINNGSGTITFDDPRIMVLNTGKNLGWEGGLIEGLKHTTSPYIVFCNDDIFVPRASKHVFEEMVSVLDKKASIGAIGASTNVVMGFQNIWNGPHYGAFTVPFLIGYCLVVRREALEQVGGVDASCPGGDDIDLSIRLREAGYQLVCYKGGFIYHHGFQTGIKVHGSPDQPNGWNSAQMTERTNDWLIRKHGFLRWWETLVGSQPLEVITE